MSTEESSGSAASLGVTSIGSPPLVSFTAPTITSDPTAYTGTPMIAIRFSSTAGSG